MGFSENAFPALTSKVESQVGTDALSREREDDIVTSLVEDLLVSSPQPAEASGSRAHIPGAWN